MLAGDMVTMSRAADHAQPSPYPNHWRIQNLTFAAVPLGLFKLSYCLSILAAGWFYFGLSSDQMQTLTFLTLILAGQANTYAMREHGHSVALAASPGHGAGIARRYHDRHQPGRRRPADGSLAPAIVAGLFMTTAAFALALDTIKVGVFKRIQID